jgi:hypothetical protein
MKYYQRYVTFEEVPDHAKDKLFQELLDHLGFKVLAEETPDYDAYSLEKENT